MELKRCNVIDIIQIQANEQFLNFNNFLTELFFSLFDQTNAWLWKNKLSQIKFGKIIFKGSFTKNIYIAFWNFQNLTIASGEDGSVSICTRSKENVNVFQHFMMSKWAFKCKTDSEFSHVSFSEIPEIWQC